MWQILSQCFLYGWLISLNYHFLLFIPLLKIQQIACKKIKRCKKTIKDGGSTTMHSKAKGGKNYGVDLTNFFFFGFREFLESFQEILNSREFSRNFTSISISRHFHFTFHFSKRVNQIFISLFTSQKEWIRFSSHFSILEKSDLDFHFTFNFSNFQYPLLQVPYLGWRQVA